MQVALDKDNEKWIEQFKKELSKDSPGSASNTSVANFLMRKGREHLDQMEKISKKVEL